MSKRYYQYHGRDICMFDGPIGVVYSPGGKVTTATESEETCKVAAGGNISAAIAELTIATWASQKATAESKEPEKAEAVASACIDPRYVRAGERAIAKMRESNKAEPTKESDWPRVYVERDHILCNLRWCIDKDIKAEVFVCGQWKSPSFVLFGIDYARTFGWTRITIAEAREIARAGDGWLPGEEPEKPKAIIEPQKLAAIHFADADLAEKDKEIETLKQRVKQQGDVLDRWLTKLNKHGFGMNGRGNTLWSMVDEVIERLAEKDAEIVILNEELENGDTWQQRSTSFLASGGCPVCFASDETGHAKTCPWGQLEQEKQIEQLCEDYGRLGKERMDDLAAKSKEIAQLIRERDEAVAAWRDAVALHLFASGASKNVIYPAEQAYVDADKFIAAGKVPCVSPVPVDQGKQIMELLHKINTGRGDEPFFHVRTFERHHAICHSGIHQPYPNLHGVIEALEAIAKEAGKDGDT